MSDRDLSWAGVVAVVFFAMLLFCNWISFTQYRRGYEAGVEAMTPEKEEIEYEYGPWQLPRIRIEEFE